MIRAMGGQMRVKPVGLAVLGAALTLGGCASAVPPFKGNDTGGIIAWTPEAQQFRHQIAAEHCAQYGKIHRITSDHRRYGDYIGFSCYWPRGYEPDHAGINPAY
jgi:hypothetical protein